MNFIVALDGPSGSGKSSISKLLAKKYNLIHIDTGAMYRSVTLYCLENDINCQNEKDVCSILNDADVSFSNEGEILLNNRKVENLIRTKIVSDNVSYVSSYKEVRLKMIEKQREIGHKLPIIMDGRDIGTFVFPNADVKLYLTASSEDRAKRRLLQNELLGVKSSYEEVLKNIIERDYIDSHREFDPSKKADDAISIDTSNLTIDEVVDKCSKIIDEKLKRCNK